MKPEIRHYKRHQRGKIWHFFKLTLSQPPVCETVNFLNPTPIIQHCTYNLADPGQAIEFKAILEVGLPIDQAEYQAAYNEATRENFSLFIDGRKMPELKF